MKKSVMVLFLVLTFVSFVLAQTPEPPPSPGTPEGSSPESPGTPPEDSTPEDSTETSPTTSPTTQTSTEEERRRRSSDGAYNYTPKTNTSNATSTAPPEEHVTVPVDEPIYAEEYVEEYVWEEPPLEPEKNNVLLISVAAGTAVFIGITLALLYLHHAFVLRKQLKDYLRQVIQQGYSFAQIKQYLSEYGWKAKEIDRAYAEVQRGA